METTSRRIAPALILSVAVAGIAGAVTAAPAPTPGPVEVFKQITADFNKGDVKAATAGFADDSAIIDEFAPYQWHGSGAIGAWLDGFTAFTKSAGWTDTKVTISSITRSDIDGDAAYVVAREVISYKQHGHRMAETGSQAVTLHNGADGWKVTGSAWAGSHPQAVVPKPAATAATGATAATPAAPAKSAAPPAAAKKP